jgi:hypothetical protein
MAEMAKTVELKWVKIEYLYFKNNQRHNPGSIRLQGILSDSRLHSRRRRKSFDGPFGYVTEHNSLPRSASDVVRLRQLN